MNSRILLGLLYLLPTISLTAGTASIQMNAFRKASGNDLDTLPDSVRFGVSFPGANVQNVTHLVTDPFVPVGQHNEWVSASYRGIVAGSGEVGETGTMLLELPAAAPSEGSVSPVVAVIPRSGSWDNYTLVPGSTLFEDATGGATFEAGQLSLAVTIGGAEYTGVVVATATGTGTLQISPFSINAGGNSYSFSAAELQQAGDAFVGEVVRLDAGVDYETVLTTLKIGAISDYDLDGVPDLTDDLVEAWFGPHESYSNGWVASSKLGFMYPYGGSGFVYHQEHGNLYVVPQDGFIFLYDSHLGWLFSSIDYYPVFYQYSADDWLYYDSLADNQRNFWNYTNGSWQSAPINP